MYRFLFLLAIVIGGLYALYKISSYMYPFIIAFILAYFMNPLVDMLEQKLKIPRAFASIISLFIIFSALGGLLTLFIVEMINGTQFLLNVVPRYLQSFVKLGETFVLERIFPIYENILSRFNELNEDNQAAVVSNIQNFGDSVADWGTRIATNVLLGISAVISSFPTTITALFISLLATFFISKDWDKLMQLKEQILPKKVIQIWNDVFQQLRNALLGFMKAQLTLVALTTITVFSGLILLRVPYAFTIALIIGIVDLLPYLGTGFILIPWITYSFIVGNRAFAVALLILYSLILVQRQMMEPKVISTHIGIHPLAVLIAVFLGYQLFGFLGFIFGPTIIVILESLRKAKVFHYIWKFIL